MCMSQTPITTWLWSQTSALRKKQTRIVGCNQGLLVLTCREKQDLAGEGRPGGGKAALFNGKEPQHSTVQVQEWGQEVGMGFNVGLGTPKVPKAISRKVWKNGLCMITNLHRKWQASLWGGETCTYQDTFPSLGDVLQDISWSEPVQLINWINAYQMDQWTRPVVLFSLCFPLSLPLSSSLTF